MNMIYAFNYSFYFALGSIFHQRLRNMFDEHKLHVKRWTTQFSTSRDFDFAEHKATKIANSIISTMTNTGQSVEMRPPISATPQTQQVLQSTMEFEQEFIDSNAV